MDECELRAFHRAALPILQRTAPAQSSSKPALTPAILDQIAWNVVLAYVANVAERPPEGMPRQVQSGEGALRGDEVRAAVEHLRQPTFLPRLKPGRASVDRFRGATHRLLESFGWAPPRAEQAAKEMAKALQASL